jgi:TolB-like protein/tetratricopeptide (TPR) repeat protein
MPLIAELKRRNVFRVGVAYAIVAWLLIEVASVLLPTFNAPDWVMKAFSSLVILGFPLTLVIAWAFELTPEGIKRDADVDPAESITHQTGRKLDFLIIGVLAIGIIYFAVDKFVLQPAPEPTEVIAEAVPAAEPTTQVKTIAVLPFANMSGDPEQEFFSDGISEELLNVLAKVKGLRVTSRTSAFAFKSKDISIPEIARQLGVDHVLEGSVRMAGDRVRITTQLIEVETDSHLWSESYDRELSDIFAVQDEIAAKVGEALKIALLGADSRPIHLSAETSMEVYTDYLLARQKMANTSFAGTGEAELLLNSVIERDPSYTPAYTALAGNYQDMASYGVLSPSEASARMMPLVEQALSRDDQLAEAWQHLAYVRQANGDLVGARAAEERALELDPQNPVILLGQIRRWQWTHEPERALVYADELLRVDPLSPPAYFWIAFLYGRLDRLDDVQRMLERIRSIDPQHNGYLWGALVLASSRGDLVTTLGLLEEATRIDPDDPEGPSWTARTYFDLGDVAAAEYWTNAALQLDPEAPWVRVMAALLHLYHDEEAEAVAIARKLAQPDSHNRFASRGIALRMVAAPDVAAGNYKEIITRYLTYYPELADGKFPIWRLSSQHRPIWEALIVTLDLASAYMHYGEKAKAESLLSLVESELPHWSRTGEYGYGFANVELHALRGDRERALTALREGAAKGIRYLWRFHLLHNPNLDSIRDTPEFAAIVAEIEADMAEQLTRVREMRRSGELTAIPELAAE